MSSNKKIAITSAVLILLIIITAASIIAIFAAAQQTVNSEVSVTYKSEYVSGTASAKYYVGEADKTGTAMRVNGEADGATSIEFNSRNNNQAQTLSPVEKEIKLSETKNFVVFEYYFTNTNIQNNYTATLTISNSNVKNMTVTTATSYEIIEDFSAIEEPVKNINQLNVEKLVIASGSAYVYVKAEITNMDNDADFNLIFNWELGEPKPTMSKLDFEMSGNHYVVKQINNNASGEIIIPDKVGEVPVTEIGEKAFFNNLNITSVIIPNGVTTIGNQAFNYCTQITKLVIPKSITSIGTSAFANCYRITGSLTIPKNISYIGEHAFENCSSLTEIILPETETNIWRSVFMGCNNAYNESESNYYLGSLENPYLLLVEGFSSTIHPQCKFIGDKAFYSSSITKIVIPDNIVSVGAAAFSNSSLTSIHLGINVPALEEQVFSQCRNLNEIIIDSDAFYSAGKPKSGPALMWFTSPYAGAFSFLQSGTGKIKVWTEIDDGTNEHLNGTDTSYGTFTKSSTTETINGKTYNVYTKN